MFNVVLSCCVLSTPYTVGCTIRIRGWVSKRTWDVLSEVGCRKELMLFLIDTRKKTTEILANAENPKPYCVHAHLNSFKIQQDMFCLHYLLFDCLKNI